MVKLQDVKLLSGLVANHRAAQFAFLGFQLLGVETFGEAEFWLGLLKIVGLFAFFMFSIVYVSTPLLHSLGSFVYLCLYPVHPIPSQS